MWNLTNVLPLTNCLESSELCYLRPTSKLSLLSKVLQRIFDEELTAFVKRKNILPPM